MGADEAHRKDLSRFTLMEEFQDIASFFEFDCFLVQIEQQLGNTK
jgi:hypothetical protein